MRLQHESDATFRWLYAELFGREELSDWPWHGRDRIRSSGAAEDEHKKMDTPTCVTSSSEGNSDDDKDSLGYHHGRESNHPAARTPHWVVRCTFLHASEMMWCPLGADDTER